MPTLTDTKITTCLRNILSINLHEVIEGLEPLVTAFYLDALDSMPRALESCDDLDDLIVVPTVSINNTTAIRQALALAHVMDQSPGVLKALGNADLFEKGLTHLLDMEKQDDHLAARLVPVFAVAVQKVNLLQITNALAGKLIAEMNRIRDTLGFAIVGYGEHGVEIVLADDAVVCD